MKLKLGQKVKDVITGFEGIVTGRCEYLTGCNRVLVLAQAKDGKAGEGSWLDEDRCEVLDETPLQLPRKTAAGFCQAPPIR